MNKSFLKGMIFFLVFFLAAVSVSFLLIRLNQTPGSDFSIDSLIGGLEDESLVDEDTKIEIKSQDDLEDYFLLRNDLQSEISAGDADRLAYLYENSFFSMQDEKLRKIVALETIPVLLDNVIFDIWPTSYESNYPVNVRVNSDLIEKVLFLQEKFDLNDDFLKNVLSNSEKEEYIKNVVLAMEEIMFRGVSHGAYVEYAEWKENVMAANNLVNTLFLEEDRQFAKELISVNLLHRFLIKMRSAWYDSDTAFYRLKEFIEFMELDENFFVSFTKSDLYGDYKNNIVTIINEIDKFNALFGFGGARFFEHIKDAVGWILPQEDFAVIFNEKEAFRKLFWSGRPDYSLELFNYYKEHEGLGFDEEYKDLLMELLNESIEKIKTENYFDINKMNDVAASYQFAEFILQEIDNEDEGFRQLYLDRYTEYLVAVFDKSLDNLFSDEPGIDKGKILANVVKCISHIEELNDSFKYQKELSSKIRKVFEYVLSEECSELACGDWSYRMVWFHYAYFEDDPSFDFAKEYSAAIKDKLSFVLSRSGGDMRRERMIKNVEVAKEFLEEKLLFSNTELEEIAVEGMISRLKVDYVDDLVRISNIFFTEKKLAKDLSPELYELMIEKVDEYLSTNNLSNVHTLEENFLYSAEDKEVIKELLNKYNIENYNQELSVKKEVSNVSFLDNRGEGVKINEVVEIEESELSDDMVFSKAISCFDEEEYYHYNSWEAFSCYIALERDYPAVLTEEALFSNDELYNLLLENLASFIAYKDEDGIYSMQTFFGGEMEFAFPNGHSYLEDYFDFFMNDAEARLVLEDALLLWEEAYFSRAADRGMCFPCSEYKIDKDYFDAFEQEYLSTKTTEELKTPKVNAIVYMSTLYLADGFSKDMNHYSFSKIEDILSNYNNLLSYSDYEAGMKENILSAIESLEYEKAVDLIMLLDNDDNNLLNYFKEQF